MKQFRIQATIAAITSVFLIGCGAGPQPLAEDDIKKSTDNAKVSRQIFDSVQGDYTKVSADDKKKLTDMYGSEKAIDMLWSNMKNPPVGGASAQGGAPLPGGN